MNTDDMILISIDDHVVEPPDMFRGHLPARYMDQAPHIVHNEEGKDQWVYEDQEMAMVGLNAVVSWPKEQWGFNPTAHAEMRPGAYNVHERVRDMNRNGVLASMCFPSMAGFSGRTFQEAKDKDLALVMLKAYNDWHIDEWCGAYPGRFIPQAILPIWDMDATVTELRRVAGKGARAVSMPELPHIQGFPSYHSPSWDPFFSAHVRPRRGHVPAHRTGSECDQPAGHQLRRVHGPLHPGDGPRRPGPALGPCNAAVPGPQDRVLRGRHRLAAVPAWTASTATTRTSGGRGRISGRSAHRTSSASTRLPASSRIRPPSSCTRRSGST